MYNKIKYLLAIVVFAFMTPVYSLDSKLLTLRNNKEAVSTLVSNSKRKAILKLYSKKEVAEIINLFEYTINNLFEDEILSEKKVCDLSFIEYISKVFSLNNQIPKLHKFEDVFVLARVENRIDDIFLQILLSLNKDRIAIEKAKRNKREPWFRSRYSDLDDFQNINFQEVFENFNDWEVNQNGCLYDVVNNLESRINNNLPNDVEVNNQVLKKSFLEAYSQGVISLTGYKTLEYIRKKSDYIHASPTLQEYFEIIFNVKDKMISKSFEQEEIPIEYESTFNSEQLKRFSTLSHRKKLYKKYDATQIFMLAQVLEKASRRMGNDPDVIASLPVITQSFSVLNGNGERTNYVETFEMDTNSQYEYARRRLRMDIIDLQNMRTFDYVNIEYTDVITAALETGYITHEDIQTVVMYDDLWNPEMPPYYRLKNFAYMLGRSSLLYLPAPWNITASIGLTAIESLLSRNQVIGEDNDNPSTLFN